MEKCLNCSKQVSIKFDYWNPNLDLLNEEEDKNTNCLEFLNKNIEFKFNTSELLIYDWFRIEGLDEIIESEKYLDGTEIGNILEVEYLLKEFNFISVYVGEHDHKILLSEEYLFCGSTNKYNQKTFKLNNETKLTNIGYIGTNWKVTIIEKEQLINILMKKYSKKAYFNQELVFSKSIINFLQENIKNKHLKVNLISNHSEEQIQFWNKIFNLENIDLNINSTSDISILAFIFRSLRSLVTENDYQMFCNYINSGNIEDFELQRLNDCQNCGKFFELKFENWQPILISSKQEETNCIDDENTIIDFEINSEEILISDWFRIDEFTEIVDNYDDYSNPSICTKRGRELSTLNFLKQGFISIHLGNSCPSVLIKNGNLYCGEVDDEKIEENLSGSVSTSLWNVTIIEKQKLIDILSTKLSIKEAINKVNKYINENDNIIKVNLDKGIYNLSFNGKHRIYQKHTTTKIKNMDIFFELKKI